VNVTDNIHRHTLFQFKVHQTLLRHEMGVGSEDDLPYVTPWKGFSVFEPLDHAFHEFRCDVVSTSFEGVEFGPFVGCIDLAAA
jgi:hypothetical protein